MTLRVHRKHRPMDIEKYHYNSYRDKTNPEDAGGMLNKEQTYRNLLRICIDLNVKSALDIGCSYGLLVEMCNTAGIDVYGLDFAIPELQNSHDRLRLSQAKFLYGSICDKAVLETIRQMDFEMIIMADTLRYLEAFESLEHSLTPRYFLIKEICNNSFVRHRRKGNTHDVRIWSPADLARLFGQYTFQRLYLPRFVYSLERPGGFTLRMVNALFPNYTALLHLKDMT